MSLMPPRDPRLCPALEVARPGDSVNASGHRSDRSPWLMLFGDGQWHRVQARAWWTDKYGRGVVQVQWHAAGDTWEETYLVAGPEKMRER